MRYAFLLLCYLWARRAESWTYELRPTRLTTRLVEMQLVKRGVEDDDDGESLTTYGNRSLAWTNRYRRLLPYEDARRRMLALGLTSKEDWEDYMEMHNPGPYLPRRPDEMYVDDWVSWDEYLGVMRPYEDARYMVQSVLRIKSRDDYESFVKADSKRAEGLRIPARPDLFYRGKGWTSWAEFVGKTSVIDP